MQRKFRLVTLLLPLLTLIMVQAQDNDIPRPDDLPYFNPDQSFNDYAATFPFSLDDLVLVYAHPPHLCDIDLNPDGCPDDEETDVEENVAEEEQCDPDAFPEGCPPDTDTCDRSEPPDMTLESGTKAMQARINAYMGTPESSPLFTWINETVTDAVWRALFENPDQLPIQDETRNQLLRAILGNMGYGYEIDHIVDLINDERLDEAFIEMDAANPGIPESIDKEFIRQRISEYIHFSPVGVEDSVRGIAPDEARQYHFFDKYNCYNFSVLFLPLQVEGLDVTDEKDRVRSAAPELITIAMLGLNRGLNDLIAPGLPDFNNETASFAMNWLATAAQTQGPGLGGPGSWPTASSLGGDWSAPQLDRDDAREHNTVEIAILDSFQQSLFEGDRYWNDRAWPLDQICGTAQRRLEGLYRIHEANVQHGLFVQALIERVLVENQIDYEGGFPVTIRQYPALTNEGVGSVETLTCVLHQIYQSHHFYGPDDPDTGMPRLYRFETEEEIEAADERFLVINMSLNLFHTNPLIKDDDETQRDEAAGSPTGEAPADTSEEEASMFDPDPHVNEHRLNMSMYNPAQEQPLPYALAIKAIIGWQHVAGSNYEPFMGNVIIVAAAGNENLLDKNPAEAGVTWSKHEDTQPEAEFPGRLPEVISVASTGVDPAGVSYSNLSQEGCDVFGGDINYYVPFELVERLQRMRSAVDAMKSTPTYDEYNNEMPASDSVRGLFVKMDVIPDLAQNVTNPVGYWWSGSSFSSALVSGMAVSYLYYGVYEVDNNVIPRICVDPGETNN